MQADEFLKALDSFIAVLSRKANKGVDRWRHDVTEAAHTLNGLAGYIPHSRVPMERVKFGGFYNYHRGVILPLYLNWGGEGEPVPYPTPPEILEDLQAFADGFAGRKPSQTAIATFDCNSGKLTLNGKTYLLRGSAKGVLKVLVKKQTALYSELQKEGDPRPDRVLRRLLANIPAAKKYIKLAIRKGKGGYKTTIQPADSVP